MTTETGAGQWGSALAFACQVFGLQCDIWQVRSSYEGKRLIDAISVKQREAFEAGVMFAQAEGIVPASESNHAIAGAIRQARQATADGQSPVIVIGVSGSGQLDLPAYAEYLAGSMADS